MSVRHSHHHLKCDWDTIDKDITPMSMPPTLEAISYQTMYSYGNHIHVSSVEKNLTSYNK
jgi:hypothetical protein